MLYLVKVLAQAFRFLKCAFNHVVLAKANLCEKRECMGAADRDSTFRVRNLGAAVGLLTWGFD